MILPDSRLENISGNLYNSPGCIGENDRGWEDIELTWYLNGDEEK